MARASSRAIRLVFRLRFGVLPAALVVLLAAPLLLAPAARAGDGMSVGACIRVLKDPASTDQQREQALGGLQDAGPAARKAIPVLVGILKQKGNAKRLDRDYAVNILEGLGAAAGPALPALEDSARSDPSSDIRQEAAEALRAIRNAGGKSGPLPSSESPKSAPAAPRPAKPSSNPTSSLPNGKAGTRLPAGYRSLDTKGKGTVLVADFLGRSSASAVVHRVASELTGVFDHGPAFCWGVKTSDDKHAVGVVEGRRQGKSMQGWILAGVTHVGSWVAVFVDEPQRLARNFRALVGIVGASVPQNTEWVRRPLPDGSGSMEIPSTWLITGAFSGAVDAKGPDGAEAHMGIAIPCMTRAAAARLMSTGIRPEIPVVDYGSPRETIKPFMHVFARRLLAMHEAGDEVTRILEMKPVPQPRGQAAFLDVLLHRTRPDGSTQKRRGIMLVIDSRTSMGNWLFYYSQISAPADRFAGDLPELLRVWRGWKVSNKVFLERMKLAMDSMTKANQIIEKAAIDRERAGMKAAKDWDGVISGFSYLQNRNTGEQKAVPELDAEKALERLNHGQKKGQWKRMGPGGAGTGGNRAGDGK